MEPEYYCIHWKWCGNSSSWIVWGSRKKTFKKGKVWKAGTKASPTCQSSYCAWFSSNSWWYPGTTERRTSRKKFGYHKNGICPIYSSKEDQSGLKICHLISDFDGFSERFQDLANHYKSIYPTSEIDVEDEFQKLKGYMVRIKLTARYMEFISYMRLSMDHQRKSW